MIRLKKKRLMGVSGGLIISVILINLISGQFRKKEPIVEAELPDVSEETIDVILETPETTEKRRCKLKCQDIEIPDTESEDNGAVDTGTEQTIQGDIEKPKRTCRGTA